MSKKVEIVAKFDNYKFAFSLKTEQTLKGKLKLHSIFLKGWTKKQLNKKPLELLQIKDWVAKLAATQKKFRQDSFIFIFNVNYRFFGVPPKNSERQNPELGNPP